MPHLKHICLTFIFVVLIFNISNAEPKDSTNDEFSKDAVLFSENEDDVFNFSIIDRVDTDFNLSRNLKPYRLNYILPVTYAYPTPRDSIRGHEYYNWEILFQISTTSNVFKFNFFDLMFSYTQRSFWQAYDDRDSRPFRETNYNPGIHFIIHKGVRFFNQDLRPEFIFEHESNGQSIEYTRSWNRISLSLIEKTGSFRWEFKSWIRLPEVYDENPEILDYMGYNEYRFMYLNSDWLLSGFVRLNPFTYRGAINLDYAVTVPWGDWLAQAHLFYGYGENLFDYYRLVTRIGVGMVLAF